VLFQIIASVLTTKFHKYTKAQKNPPHLKRVLELW